MGVEKAEIPEAKPRFVSKLTQFAILLNQIHLGEDIDMGKLHVQHCGQGGAEHGDELGRVGAVMRVHEMHRRQLEEAQTCGRNWSQRRRRQQQNGAWIIFAIRPKAGDQELTLKFHLASWENIFLTDF